jgi:Na+-driven multidrug efflux pump
MYYDLTKGKISKNLILFALPMMAGNLMQQFYNIADTLIVGRVVGKNALAAVGVRLYTYDLFDLDFSGTFHGGRSLIFHL